jgi:hypothetical protein
MSDGQACGDCGLLAHMSVVPSVQAPFAITVRAIAHEFGDSDVGTRRART